MRKVKITKRQKREVIKSAENWSAVSMLVVVPAVVWLFRTLLPMEAPFYLEPIALLGFFATIALGASIVFAVAAFIRLAQVRSRAI